MLVGRNLWLFVLSGWRFVILGKLRHYSLERIRSMVQRRARASINGSANYATDYQITGHADYATARHLISQGQRLRLIAVFSEGDDQFLVCATCIMHGVTHAGPGTSGVTMSLLAA